MSKFKKNQANVNEGNHESTSLKRSKSGDIMHAVKKAITEIWMAGSVLGPAPQLASSTFIPETAVTIAASAPTMGTAANVITLSAAAAATATLANSCDHPDIDKPKVEIPPAIRSSGITITKPETLRIDGNQVVYLGNRSIATCTDPSGIRNILITIDGISVSLPTTISKTCTIGIKAIDNSENSNPSDIEKVKVIYENNETPEFSVYKPKVIVSQGDKITKNNKNVFVGSEETFAWNSDNYVVSLSFDGEPVQKLPITLEVGEHNLECTLTNKDNAKLYITKTTSITAEEIDDNEAPTISRERTEANIFGGITVTMDYDNNQLSFGDLLMATGNDDNTKKLTMSFEVDGQPVASGKIVSIPTTGTHKGKLTFTDEKNKSNSGEIELYNNTEKAINGTADINNLHMQAYKETDLLNGVSFNDAEIIKVEIKINGQRYEVTPSDNEKYNYTPTSAGSAQIRLTIKGPMGNVGERTSNILTIEKAQFKEYEPITITNINPADVFPQILEIEAGDPNIYEYVKDLGIAEVYVMRSMISDYGAGDYTPEEIQKLQSRIITGLIGEKPADYENYERIGPAFKPNTDDHSEHTFQKLISLIGKHTKIMNLSSLGDGRSKNLSEYAKNHPNNIFVFSCSMTKQEYNRDAYNKYVFNQDIVDLCDLPNVVIYTGGGDDVIEDGINIKTVCNGTIKSNSVIYNYSGMANSNQDNYPNSNMRVVIGTDPKGNADMTNSHGSAFPFGFNDNIIVSGRPVLPIYNNGELRGDIVARNGSYTVSYMTPTIASEAQEMFGVRPDVKDANELLQMIESTTTDPDYISLNGAKQALPKYSPANFSKKYCLIADIPSNIKMGEFVLITKLRYKGIDIEIPGAKVKINGEWVPCDKEHESLIKSQNPMYLEWGVDTNESIKYGNKKLKGKIKAVDDHWNGLNIEKDIEINIE